jgi:hypothetical protein
MKQHFLLFSKLCNGGSSVPKSGSELAGGETGPASTVGSKWWCRKTKGNIHILIKISQLPPTPKNKYYIKQCKNLCV